MTVAVGQLWTHVGDECVPASGLLLRVERVEPPFFYASYPGEVGRRGGPAPLRRYRINGFDRMYKEAAPAPMGPPSAPHAGAANSQRGSDE